MAHRHDACRRCADVGATGAAVHRGIGAEGPALCGADAGALQCVRAPLFGWGESAGAWCRNCRGAGIAGGWCRFCRGVVQNLHLPPRLQARKVQRSRHYTLMILLVILLGRYRPPPSAPSRNRHRSRRGGITPTAKISSGAWRPRWRTCFRPRVSRPRWTWR